MLKTCGAVGAAVLIANHFVSQRTSDQRDVVYEALNERQHSKPAYDS